MNDDDASSDVCATLPQHLVEKIIATTTGKVLLPFYVLNNKYNNLLTVSSDLECNGSVDTCDVLNVIR